MKTFAVCAALSLFILITSGFAKTAIEGDALSSDGRPMKNGQVRIEQENTRNPAVMAKTDAKGHFVVTGLPVASYKVTLLAAGKIVSTAQHVQTRADRPVLLQLGGKQVAATTRAVPVVQKKKRWVWVPPSTGSHRGGWQEVNQDGSADPQYDAQNVGRMNPEQLARFQTKPFIAPKIGGE